MKRKLTVSQNVFISNVVLIFVIVLLTGGISLYFALSSKQRDLDAAIYDVAEMVTQMDVVREDLQIGRPSEELNQRLTLILHSMEDVDVLVVCDTSSIRLFHNEDDRIGGKFVGSDERDILLGEAPYISVAVGTLGLQRRAFHAVLDEDGAIIGFVMASVLNSHLTDIRNEIILTFFIVLVCMIGVGLLISAGIMYHLRKILLGHQPEEFSNLYIERDEVLDALEEGLFAISNDGRIILMNQSAKEMLDLSPEEPAEGRSLAELFPENRFLHVLRTGIPEHNIDLTIKGQNIISSRIPIFAEGKMIGAVSILRNKTETTKLAEELTGAKYMVDTLRAFNHEFMNKLHIILGYLELNEVAKAKDYILGTSLVSGEAVSDIAKRVPLQNLAALLIGKIVRARELGIQLSLKPDSCFETNAVYLPADCYVTLIGNLLENAMDELNSGTWPTKEIELGVYIKEGHTIITCDDTGGGIPENLLASIYDRHTTTKGEGHGTGFALMKEIVDRYQGTIQIDTEKDIGTSIEITLPV